MDFRQLFPLVDFSDQYTFKHCLTLQDFLKECVSIYFDDTVVDQRVKESCLSVYMAFRDHYPTYLEYLDQAQVEQLDFNILHSSSKIIKLRRIVIGALSKVA